MIAAGAVLGERSFDLVGEPQWIIFDPGHWVVPDAQMVKPCNVARPASRLGVDNYQQAHQHPYYWGFSVAGGPHY